MRIQVLHTNRKSMSGHHFFPPSSSIQNPSRRQKWLKTKKSNALLIKTPNTEVPSSCLIILKDAEMVVFSSLGESERTAININPNSTYSRIQLRCDKPVLATFIELVLKILLKSTRVDSINVTKLECLSFWGVLSTEIQIWQTGFICKERSSFWTWGWCNYATTIEPTTLNCFSWPVVPFYLFNAFNRHKSKPL